jgi:hypothetical protein
MYSNFLARQRQKSAENAEVVVKEDGDYTIVSETVTPECGMDPAMNGYTVSNFLRQPPDPGRIVNSGPIRDNCFPKCDDLR